MLTRERYNEIEKLVKAGKSVKGSTNSDAERKAYSRMSARIAGGKKTISPITSAVESLPVVFTSTQDACEKIQQKVLSGIYLALCRGEPWAYREAVNVLSKLVPEWKEKHMKKQVPLDAYQKLLEKALKK